MRTGHLLLGCLNTPTLRNALYAISRQFEQVKADALADDFAKILASSPEAALAASRWLAFRRTRHARRGERRHGAGADGQAGGAEAILRRPDGTARNGEIDPIVGRDEEIRQVVDVLMRRRQNNPILTGEAGRRQDRRRGRLRPAHRRAATCRRRCKEVSLRTLDVGLLQAGASMKGEFENRLRQVIEEVQSSPKPIILFIDEAHTLIGAGGAAGTGDAANLLKPALARGTLRTVAATTWAEYKKYFEKDPALTRRFQVVQVDEPSEQKAILMMRGIASPLEKHHRVQILDEAIEAAVELSHRYIPARQLPDKSVSLLDTACAARRGQPARGAGRGRRLPPAHRGAGDRTATSSAARRAIGIDADHRARQQRQTAARPPSASASSGSRSAGSAEKALVDKVLALRAQAARRHGAGRYRGDRRRGRRRRRPRGRQRQRCRPGRCRCRSRRMLAELKRCRPTRRAPGRVAADPAECGRAGHRRRWLATGPASRSAGW